MGLEKSVPEVPQRAGGLRIGPRPNRLKFRCATDSVYLEHLKIANKLETFLLVKSQLSGICSPGVCHEHGFEK
jgi:hypothetical protein